MEGFDKESKASGCLETLRDRVYELKKISQDPYFTEYLMSLQERVIKEKHAVDLLYDELERKYKFYLERMEKASNAQETVEETKPVDESETVIMPETVEQTPVLPAMHTPNVDIPVQVAVKPKKNSEFTIGIVVFSIVGVVFLLTAFAMLGAHFMNSFAKGMSLYAIAVIICLFSELFVHRRSQKLSQVLTILGIAGVHVSTYVNTYVMFNMHWIVAAVLVVLTTVAAVVVDKCRRRKEWKFDGLSVGAYYLFAVASYWMFATQELNIWKSVITLVILAVLTRVLSWKNKQLYPLDAILTTIIAIFAWTECGEVYGYVLLAVLLLSAVTIRFWHLYYQSLITVITVLFSIFAVESELF